MKNKVIVFANFKAGFGMELQKIYLEKGNCKIELSKEDWQEIQDTLSGKRKTAQGEIEEGSYYPKEMVCFNTES